MLGVVLVMVAIGKTSAQPVVSIADTQVIEGNSGTTNAEFILSLAAPYSNPVTVEYSTFEVPYDFLNEPYPAKSDSDFIATNGTVTFAPGETNKSVFVQVIGDTINEANEPFGLSLDLQGPGTLTRSNARCVILDDDPLEIQIDEIQFLEPTAGTTQYVRITMTVLEPTEQIVYGTFSTSAGTADASDFQLGYGPNSWTYYPGPPATNVFIGSVGVYGDSLNEDDETFFVTPSLGYGRFRVQPRDTNPPNARGVVFLNQGQCTIINDDFYLSVQQLSGNRTQLTLFGALNATHVLQASADLVNWSSFSTNTLGPERQVSVVVTNSENQFFRALRTVTVSQ